jgi:hypothetical protein
MHHGYHGYVLRLDGMVQDDRRQFTVAIGKAAHTKHQFRVGDEIAGESERVTNLRLETAEFYKTSKLKVLSRGEAAADPRFGPPYHGVPPDLPTYRSRGHRRLSAKTYEAKCTTCIWGCRMPVEIIVDQWNPRVKQYRFETFCYGPKSCGLHSAGAKRTVPGRRGMTHVEEDWVYEEMTRHRAPDE